MKKQTIIAASIVALLGLGGVTYQATQQNNQQTKSPQTPKTSQTTKSSDITFSSDKKTVQYEGVADETALVTLQSLTTVTTESTAYGDMVTGINGVVADPQKEFWAFYVNGTMANEGAGTYKAAASDKLEWRLEQLQ